MNPSIRLPSKFLSLSSTFLRYRASGSSCFLRAINIVQPVSVANQFSRNVVFFQHVCELFPTGRSGCCRSFSHQVMSGSMACVLGITLLLSISSPLGLHVMSGLFLIWLKSCEARVLHVFGTDSNISVSESLESFAVSTESHFVTTLGLSIFR